MLPVMARRINETAKRKQDAPEFTTPALSKRFPLVSWNSSDLGKDLIGLLFI